jgi:MarR family transcriptional regulator, 2-MHQ and catechol-resistance regulon repressor
MLDIELDNQLDSESESRNSLRLWLHLVKCAKLLEQEMSDRFRETYDSSFSRFDVLAHLSQAGKAGLSTSILAANLLASKGNITRLLDRMGEDGLVERKLSSEDRRVSKIYLSAQGQSLFERMAADHESWAHELFTTTSTAEKEELLRLLKQIRTAKG